MRRLILSGFVVCFSIISLFATVTVNISSENMIIQQGLNSTTFEGASLYSEPGHPLLPVYTCAVLLPPDVDLNSVRFSIDGLVEETLGGIYSVQPAPLISSEGGKLIPENKNIVNGKNISVYSINEFYPDRYIRTVKVGKLHCYTVATVVVQLAQYNPVTKNLKQLKNGTLTATWSKDPMYNSLLNASVKVPESTKKKVKNIAVNYDEIAPLYDRDFTFADTTTYVIITTEAIQNGSAQLSSFIESRRNKGFNVQVILESTLGCPANQFHADSIRLWLQNNYQSLAIEYVLLIGCPHMTSGDVPMKTVTLGTDRHIGTDFYYAQLSSDINDTNDHHADVDVGRIPLFFDNISVVDTVLQRSMAYESEKKEDIGWRTNALLLSDPIDSQTTAAPMFELLRTNTLDPAGWTYYRIYGDSTGNPDEYPVSIPKVGRAWNSNKFGLIQYSAHGTKVYVRNVLNLSAVGSLTKTYNPIVFQGSCTNGAPTDPLNISQALLERCALSLVTATHLSIYCIGADVFAHMPYSQGYNYEFGRAIVNDSLTVAKAINQVKSTLVGTSAYWANIMAYNVYGVPDIGVYSCNNITPVVYQPSFAENSFDVQFYRNRFYFQVPQNAEKSKGVKIDIYNMQGKRVITYHNRNRKSEKVESLSLDEIFAGRQKPAAGLYLCKLTAGIHTKAINVIIK